MLSICCVFLSILYTYKPKYWNFGAEFQEQYQNFNTSIKDKLFDISFISFRT